MAAILGSMGALICLQGGEEFTPACRPMDDRLLARAPGGPVVIAPFACAPGRDYRAVGEAGAAYYTSLGVPGVRVATEPRLSVAGTVRSIVRAGTVVIPSGCPVRLRATLIGTAIGAALRAHAALGGMVVGAMAGAMALAAWMMRSDGDGVLTGLGLVPHLLVVPGGSDGIARFDDTHRRRVAGWMTVVGIPACSGVVYDRGRLRAVGAHESWVVTAAGTRIRLSASSQLDPAAWSTVA